MGQTRQVTAACGLAAFLAVVFLYSAGPSGCGSGGATGGGGTCTPDLTYNPSFNPADFSTTIDNPLLSLVPGTHYVYESPDETVDITVTNETKVLAGVTCVEVHDTVTSGGEVVEDTLDWFAQDKDGNVWYCGEDTKELEGGKVVTTEGSWQAGVDGAKPGIIMHEVQPPIGQPYRQEYSPCNAEDFADVVSLDESVTVPYGSFDHCLQTHESTPLEPALNEYKFYCPGVGLALEVDVVTGARTELTEITMP
jgi:hypothetical protein